VKKLPATFWLTRDHIGGELAPRIDVWASEPRRKELKGGDAIWLPAKLEDVDAEDNCIGELTLDEARRLVGNGIPETSRECIRSGDVETRLS
jgi:hypothetical protein